MLRWYYLATAFFMFHAMEASSFMDRIVYGEWEGKSGDKITQSLNLLLMGTSLALFARGFRRIGSIRTGATLAIILAIFLICSIAWSFDPAISLRQGILYLFVVLGSIGVVTNLKSDEYMDLLAFMGFLAAAGSLAAAVVLPAADNGDFRGIFSQKNVLGEAMTMAALASLHGFRAGRRKRLRSAVFLTFDTIVALLSHSATSCLVIFAFCGADVMTALIRKGGATRAFAITVIVFALPAMISLAAFPDVLLDMIGKDPTLTGRTDIWGFVLDDIYEKPWLGWGYIAFWLPTNPAAMQISDALHWFVPQAHNGLLEMLLNVGLIGTAFLLFLWSRTVSLSLRCLKTSEKVLAISCLFSCAGIIIVGISETVLIVPLEASTSVFFITGLYCERAVRASRLRRQPAVYVRRQPAIRRDFSPGVPVGAEGVRSGNPLRPLDVQNRRR